MEKFDQEAPLIAARDPSFQLNETELQPDNLLIGDKALIYAYPDNFKVFENLVSEKLKSPISQKTMFSGSYWRIVKLVTTVNVQWIVLILYRTHAATIYHYRHICQCHFQHQLRSISILTLSTLITVINLPS